MQARLWLHPSRRARCALLRMRYAICDLVCDCPTGKSLKPVQPSREKYSASRSPQITPTNPAIPRSRRGAYRDRHGRRARGAVAAAAPGVQTSLQGELAHERRPRADERRKTAFAKTSADGYQTRRRLWQGCVADGKAVWFWHPWLVSSRRRCCEAQPGFVRSSIRRRRRQKEFVSGESTV
jgi:hypothetical protein